MLKRRVIPLLLIDGPNLVKGKKFDNWRRVGTLVPAVNVHNGRDVDELVVIDAGATMGNRSFDFSILAQVRGRCFVPLTVGGGVRTLEEASMLIELGADKVLIGSSCSKDMKLVKMIAEKYGSQAVVVSVDVRRELSGLTCWTHGGSNQLSVDPCDRGRAAIESGAGEILVNSIDRDGEMNGFDIELMAEMVREVKVPVIAAGGAGSINDVVEVFDQAGVAAAVAGSLFQFTEVTPASIRDALAARGHPVRSTQ